MTESHGDAISLVMKLKVKYVSDDMSLRVKYETEGSSGIDLRAAHDAWIPAGCRYKIATGIAVELPPGTEGQVRPRSGLFARLGVHAALGTIDNDYRGEVGVVLINDGPGAYSVKKGDRIAQLVVAPVCRCEIVEVSELSDTKRGAGGFGSTGR